jgi:hypothetical protein
MSRLQIVIELTNGGASWRSIHQDQEELTLKAIKNIFDERKLGFSSVKKNLVNEEGEIVGEIKGYNIMRGDPNYNYFD